MYKISLLSYAANIYIGRVYSVASYKICYSVATSIYDNLYTNLR